MFASFLQSLFTDGGDALAGVTPADDLGPAAHLSFPFQEAAATGNNAAVLQQVTGCSEVRLGHFVTDRRMWEPVVIENGGQPVLIRDDLLVIEVADTTSSLYNGVVLAQVTHNTNGQYGIPVKIGKLVDPVRTPVINTSNAILSVIATELVIVGTNFGQSSNAVRVYLIPTFGPAPVATVITCSDSQLIIRIHGLVSANVGALNAIVTVADPPCASS